MHSRQDSFAFKEVVRSMELFSNDRELMDWFLSLQGMTEPVRTVHLQSMVAKMRTTGEPPELIAVIESLISPDIFKDAVRIVLSVGTI